MALDIDHLTTFTTAILALLAGLAASACDDPEDPGSLAALAARDGASGDALDRADAPEPQAGLNPEGFYIEEVKAKGVGCPDPGAVTILMSPNKTALRIIYHEMSLENPSGAAVQTTNCQAALKLHIPAGWKVAPSALTTRGYAKLDPSIKARHTSSVFFAGVPLGAKYHTELNGPFNDFYQSKDLLPPASPVWSPCGESAILGINNTLTLNAAMNPEGAAIFHLYDQRLVSWQWEKC